MTRVGRRARTVLLAGVAFACASSPPDATGPDYLRWVAFEAPFNEHFLLRWPSDRMPLRVHLPDPPASLFPDPEAIEASVRDGILDWSDVAGPGIPSFRFVETEGDADIRIRWAERPSGNWYVAYCAYQIDALQRRFGVEHVLVTGRWRDGHLADMHDVYAVVLHEMGHALGLIGHSPEPGDIMYASATITSSTALSERDRATLRALYAKPIGTRIMGARRERAVVY